MKRSFIFVVTVIAALLGTGYFLWNYAGTNRTLVFSGVIEADHIHVGSKLGGRVLKVVAREGETVKAGEPLILLEPHDLDAALAEAQATLHHAEARLALLSAGYRKEEIEQAEAAAKQAQAELDQLVSGPRRQELDQVKADWSASEAQAERLRKSLKRTEDLTRRDLIPRRDYEEALSKTEEAELRAKVAHQRYDALLAATRPEDLERVKQRLAEAEARLRQLRSGFRKEEIAQATSAVEAAQAKVQWIRTQLDETVIKAPADALVEKLDIETGDLVSAGKPVALLVRTGSLWVRTYLPQAQLRYARPGTKANVRVDAYPGTDFDGVIRRIHLENDSAPMKLLSREERALQVVQTEVMIADPENMLRPGMNADVIIAKKDTRNTAQAQSELRAN
ncbi:MAG TPA: efflux RND transporter periplasmic adaptor subunit [Candidatus Binatia bacterium]